MMPKGVNFLFLFFLQEQSPLHGKVAAGTRHTLVMTVVHHTYATKVTSTARATAGRNLCASSVHTRISSMAVGMKVNTTALNIIPTLRVPAMDSFCDSLCAASISKAMYSVRGSCSCGLAVHQLESKQSQAKRSYAAVP